MSLLNVKCGVGRQEFTAHEPDDMRAARRFIAERARDEGAAFPALLKIMRRLDEGDTVKAGAASYWIERF